MATVIVGIGDMAVSKNKGDQLRTFGLGSCICVVAVDPTTSITGMLHFVLPESSLNPERAKATPAYFGDSGIAALVAAMEAAGAPRSRRWIVKLAGGAKVLHAETSEALDIGKRNALAARKVLWKFGLAPVAEDTGKNHSRTVTVVVGTPTLEIANREVGDVRL